MADSITDLRRMYEAELRKGPFPTQECEQARMTGEEHGILVLYLADIAGLASRGEKVRDIPEPERSRFREMASRNLYQRCPGLQGRVSPESTPKLYAQVAATERARLVILQALS